MSLRSASLIALFVVLLFAVSVAAQWSDIFISYQLNITATKICAIDAPTRCYYVPKLNMTEAPKNILFLARYNYVTSSGGTITVIDPADALIRDYSMLNYITYSTSGTSWAIVNITQPGLIYTTTGTFWVRYGSNTITSSSYTVCGQTYSSAYYVSTPGLYNITPFKPPHYWLDINKCTAYRISATSSGVRNMTQQWFTLYVAMLYPNTTKIYYDSSVSAYVLNGTRHSYLTYFHILSMSPRGRGFYTAGSYVAPTLVMPYYYSSGFYSYRGPFAFNASNPGIAGGSPGDVLIHYNIGPYPGDGFVMAVLLGAVASPPARLAYIANDSIGYFYIERPSTSLGAGYIFFYKRYNVVEVAFTDALYTYITRGIACPAVTDYGTKLVGWVLNRPDRINEIEICNNRTDTVHISLFYGFIGGVISGIINSVTGAGFYAYMYADMVPPGKCARLRWDTGLASKPYLRIYNSTQHLCKTSNYIISTTSYNPGWRHFFFQNNTLKAVAPITPDYNYVSTWLEIIDYLNQQYNATINALLQAFKTQANGTQALLNYMSSTRFLGTIRMDSATSTWLRTVYNELQKWQVSGPSASFGTISLPPIPTAVAPAAAAAAAVAWAASRRDDDVATTAAVAGIALALFGILMTLIYGTESLALVALGVIVAAAAVAWRRIS